VRFEGKSRWRKRDLHGYIREYALTTADCMVERTAEDMARMDRTASTYGWSPEFAQWYGKNREEWFITKQWIRVLIDATQCNPLWAGFSYGR